MNPRTLLAALVLGTRTLAAQQPTPPAMRAPMGHAMGDPMALQEMMGPMMQVLVYTPQHLLARKEALGLTSDQVARLTTLRNAAETGEEVAMADAKGHVQAMQQATAGPTLDTAAVKTHFEAAHAAMGKAHWLALVSAGQGEGGLNDAQRTKGQAWGGSMQTWVGEHHRVMKTREEIGRAACRGR